MATLRQLAQYVGVELHPPEHPDHLAKRSSHWPTFRKYFLQKNPVCVVSGLKVGGDTQIDIHHVVPYHVDPKLELDEKNCRTIARPYHYLIGHACNWKVTVADFDKLVEYLKTHLNFAVQRWRHPE